MTEAANDNRPELQVDGEQLLDDIKAALRRYSWLAGSEQHLFDVEAVWVLWTYVCLHWSIAPQLQYWSPLQVAARPSSSTYCGISAETPPKF